MERFGTILTSAGLEAVTACMVQGTKLDITQLAVGDGEGAYYDPAEAQTELRREVWRGPAQVAAVPDNPRRVQVAAVIPSSDGGFSIREAGVFDAQGRMIAVSKYALTEKPSPDSGAAKETYIQLVIDVVNAGAVAITIDSSAAMVTKKELEDAIGDLTQQIQTQGGGIVVIPEGEDIPVAERKPKTFYFQVTDVQAGGGTLPESIAVSPNMALKPEPEPAPVSRSGIDFT